MDREHEQAIGLKLNDLLTMEERIENKDKVIEVKRCRKATRYLKMYNQGTLVIKIGMCDPDCMSETVDIVSKMKIPPQCWVCFNQCDEIIVSKPKKSCCVMSTCEENISLYVVCSAECAATVHQIMLSSCTEPDRAVVQIRDKDCIWHRTECVNCTVLFTKFTKIYCYVCRKRVINPFDSERIHQCVLGVFRMVCGSACIDALNKKFYNRVCKHCNAIAMLECPCKVGCYYCDEVCWYEDKKHLALCTYLKSKGIINADRI